MLVDACIPVLINFKYTRHAEIYIWFTEHRGQILSNNGYMYTDTVAVV